MRFIFNKDYKTKTRDIKKGTICSVFDYEVVINNGKWLFDVDSLLAKELGEIIE